MAPPWLHRSTANALPLLTVFLASTAACDTLLDPTAPDPEGLGERTAELERRWPAETPTAPALLANLEATGWADAEVAGTLTCAGAGTLDVRINPVTGSLTARLRHDRAHSAVITALSLDGTTLPAAPTAGAGTAARATGVAQAIGTASATSLTGTMGAISLTRATRAITGTTTVVGTTTVAGVTSVTGVTSASALTVRIAPPLPAGRPLAGALRVEAAGASATTWTLRYDVPTREAALAHAWWERAGVEVEELDELIKEFGWLVAEAERAPRASSPAAFLAVFDRLEARRAHLTRAAPPWPAITLGCPVAAPSAR